MLTMESDRTTLSSEVRRDRSRALGSILVEQGKLTPVQVEEVQRYAELHGLRFGDAAMRLKYLTSEDVESALASQFNYPVLPRGGPTGVSAELVSGHSPQSDQVESLRHLRSQLLMRWPGDTPRCVAIVSPERGEGRSWLAANLATVFAHIGQRTLLIDADMRHPRQHRIFNVPNEVGLSALLTGRAGKEIIRRINPHLRLFLLTAGLLPPNPQELLARSVFDLVLARLNDMYDTIIIDTPALSNASDAHLLASRAGCAIMVARRNRTRQHALLAAMHSIVQSGATVVGSVISEH